MRHDKAFKWIKRTSLGLLGIALIVAALYVINAYTLDQYEPEITRIEKHEEKSGDSGHIRVLAFNVHRCDAIKEGGIFGYTPQGDEVVGETVGKIAAFLREQNADIVFMSEICAESFLSHTNQIEALAEQAGYAWAVFGHNSSFGLPFARHRSGNAILSKYPISSAINFDVIEPHSPLQPKTNRRILKAIAEINGKQYSLYSVHLAAHYPAPRLRQAKKLHEVLSKDNNEIIMGGDFNDTPDSEPMRIIRSLPKIRTAENFEPTYVRWPPEHTIDYVFGPKSCQLVSYKRVINNLSDHYPVVAVFDSR